MFTDTATTLCVCLQVAAGRLKDSPALQRYFDQRVFCIPHNNLPVESYFNHAKIIDKRAKGRLSAGRASQINQHLVNTVLPSRPDGNSPYKPTKENLSLLQESVLEQVSAMRQIDEKALKPRMLIERSPLDA